MNDNIARDDWHTPAYPIEPEQTWPITAEMIAWAAKDGIMRRHKRADYHVLYIRKWIGDTAFLGCTCGAKL